MLFYRFNLPVLLLYLRRTAYPAGYTRRIARHIAEFSLAALAALGPRSTPRTAPSPRRRLHHARASAVAERRARLASRRARRRARGRLLPAACGTVAMLTRPEGDGGWSAQRRTREHELADASGVA